MPRFLLPITLLLVLLAGAGAGALAWAGDDAAQQIAPGVRVAGLDVGGMDREQAIATLETRLLDGAMREATIKVGDRRFRLSAEEAGVRTDIDGAVARAEAAGREGSIFKRGWRTLTGGEVDHEEVIRFAVDAKAVRAFVGEAHAHVARRAVDATLKLNLTSVSLTESRPGRRLAGREDLVERITAAMKDPEAERDFRSRAIEVEPKVTRDDLFDQQPVAVTVDASNRRVRVFRRGELVKSYDVAVGMKEYPTPLGQFAVQREDVNPVWNVPNSDWAGSLAGQTIPGGDPRNPLIARFLAFNGSVGFHGTKSIGSLGSAASHGCIRMRPADVIDLDERISVGTPVLVA